MPSHACNRRIIAASVVLPLSVLALGIVFPLPSASNLLSATDANLAYAKGPTKAQKLKYNRNAIRKAIENETYKAEIPAKYQISFKQADKIALGEFSYSGTDNFWYYAYGVSQVRAIQGDKAKKGCADGYTFLFADAQSELPKMFGKPRAMAKKIAKKAKKHSSNKTEQLKYVHNYLITHTSYATAKNAPKTKVWDHMLYMPYGPLVAKKAYCAGYSTAFAIIASYLGVTNKIVVGPIHTGEIHQWNSYNVKGKWRYTDLCWDDPMTASNKDCGSKYKSYAYWNKTASQMQATERRNHGKTGHKMNYTDTLKPHKNLLNKK